MEEFLNVTISFVESLTLLTIKCHEFDCDEVCAARLLFEIVFVNCFKNLARALLY